MTLSPVERFVGLIRDETGNVVPPARHAFVAGLLERRVAAGGFSDAHAYLDALAEGRLGEEWGRLVPMVTIKESYFFRAPQQFAAIADRVLPELVRRRAATRRLRFWCAAAARGEEAGTLALILAESELLAGWDWRIVASDLDGEALEAAERGLYGERSVAHVPPAQLERWFRRRGKLFELSAALRRRIDHRPLNLVRSLAPVAAEGAFDLVLLRNVLIYFRRPVQRRVVAAVGDLLAPDGALFLGASETLWQIQDRLAAFDLGTCFCYRHRPEGSDRALHPWPGEAGGAMAVPAPAARREEGGSGAPRVPAERAPARPALMPSPAATRPPADGRTPSRPAEPTPPPSPRPGEPPHLLHADPCGIQERLAAAAALLVGNDLAAAGREIGEVLESEPSEPAAQALDGFLHDLLGEWDDAVTSYRAALYLDPALFQVRVLLADLLARRGQRDRAAHQYRETLATLAAGHGRPLVALDALPLPDRVGAEKRCRQALRGK